MQSLMTCSAANNLLTVPVRKNAPTINDITTLMIKITAINSTSVKPVLGAQMVPVVVTTKESSN
jgi:hypothetical protein